jgi:hypothetical protein
MLPRQITCSSLVVLKRSTGLLARFLCYRRSGESAHFHSLQRLNNRFGEHAVALFSQDVFAAARTIETCASEMSVRSRANENIYAATAALRQCFSSQLEKKLPGVREEPESG